MKCWRSSRMGVFLSNGPGDPEPVDYAVKAIREMMGRTPIFGICLGHQLTGLALGGKTYKLKFGHHGGNHPVKNMTNGKVEITAHNHNFAVDPESINANEVELTHVDLNDNTLEGCGIRRCRCSACSIIRRLLRGRMIRTICSGTSAT
jgi:carbamoyl-phosphate synthase small subunit